MSVEKEVIEKAISANATKELLWQCSCPTVVNRKIVEVRASMAGAGVLHLYRETDEKWCEEKILLDKYNKPDVVDIDWSAGVTIYFYGTDRSGASNAIKISIFYEEVPI